jgi:hypothetical protein
MTTHWTERLSEFHDGDLSPAEYAECAAHLAACAACRDVLQELHLVAIAARTDENRQPSTDLWPGILARINKSAPAEAGALVPFPAVRDRAAARSRQIAFSLPQLALAASLLIAVSSGVSYLASQRNAGPGPAVAERSASRETPIQAVGEPLGAPSNDLVPANFADAQYDKAVSDLERTLLEQRDKLDPRTVVVIERNLATIDDAIRQAREALDADPANTYLNSHLADARRRKLELLRRATSIAGD